MLSSSKYIFSYHHTTGFLMGIIMTFSTNITANYPIRAH